jgi:hypothetical protein
MQVRAESRLPALGAIGCSAAYQTPIRKAGSRGQLNVEISLGLQEHFRQHCEENRLQRVDAIEALLRTWMTNRDDPPPLNCR